MIPWLIAISLFWTLTAIYLGGMDVDVEGGGGVRQVGGLLVTFALFLAAWYALRQLMGGLGPVVGNILLPSAIVVLLLPVLARGGFLLVGVRIRRVEAAGHH